MNRKVLMRAVRLVATSVATTRPGLHARIRIAVEASGGQQMLNLAALSPTAWCSISLRADGVSQSGVVLCDCFALLRSMRALSDATIQLRGINPQPSLTVDGEEAPGAVRLSDSTARFTLPAHSPGEWPRTQPSPALLAFPPVRAQLIQLALRSLLSGDCHATQADDHAAGILWKLSSSELVLARQSPAWPVTSSIPWEQDRSHGPSSRSVTVDQPFASARGLARLLAHLEPDREVTIHPGQTMLYLECRDHNRRSGDTIRDVTFATQCESPVAGDSPSLNQGMQGTGMHIARLPLLMALQRLPRMILAGAAVVRLRVSATRGNRGRLRVTVASGACAAEVRLGLSEWQDSWNCQIDWRALWAFLRHARTASISLEPIDSQTILVTAGKSWQARLRGHAHRSRVVRCNRS